MLQLRPGAAKQINILKNYNMPKAPPWEAHTSDPIACYLL